MINQLNNVVLSQKHHYLIIAKIPKANPLLLAIGILHKLPRFTI